MKALVFEWNSESDDVRNFSVNSKLRKLTIEEAFGAINAKENKELDSDGSIEIIEELEPGVFKATGVFGRDMEYYYYFAKNGNDTRAKELAQQDWDKYCADNS